MEKKLAKQFRRMNVQINEPRPAFDMYIAVWSNMGFGECVIGAPSMATLEARWLQITRTTLDAARAQHVLVLHCDAPEELMAIAKNVTGGSR